MAKKRTPSKSSEESRARPAVTPERFRRLCKLVRYLARRPRTREQITRHLKLDLRAFYRDLELLRSAGIPLQLAAPGYTLGEPTDKALARLPFPDPLLTLGEAQQLARGRSRVHRWLRQRIEELMR
jgi:predicted DNA-binding transcriptional regulator YafY